jgi:hypothetical protein
MLCKEEGKEKLKLKEVMVITEDTKVGASSEKGYSFSLAGQTVTFDLVILFFVNFF